MTNAELDIELDALKVARDSLSAFTVGEGLGRLNGHEQVLLGVVYHWTPAHQMFEPIGNMVVDLVSNNRISPMQTQRYAALLAMAMKVIKAKKTFRRKTAKTCSMPKLHGQPCFCAKLYAMKMEKEQPKVAVRDWRKEEKVALKAGLEAIA